MPSNKPVITYRLSSEAYAQVEKTCTPIFIGSNTTQLQAAFIAGQQSVLKVLRENIVVPSP